MNGGERTERVRTLDVRDLTLMVLRRWFTAIVLFGLILFVPAWTLDYWQAWMFLAMVALSSLFVLVHFLKNDPELIRRRMKVREKEREQRSIIKVSLLLFAVAFVIPGLDHRFGWSHVPTAVVLAADVIIFLGYVLFVRVLKENRYASRVVEVEEGQYVISTGPYAIVRHPMYVAVLMIYVVSPLALGSFWGMAASVWFIPLLVARIRNEEKVLLDGLAGYREYSRRTRYRLMPGVW